MTTSEKPAAEQVTVITAGEGRAEALQGNAVGIFLMPAIIQSPHQAGPARLVCQDDAESSADLQEKLAQQLIDKLGRKGAIETCRSNSWDRVLAHILKSRG